MSSQAAATASLRFESSDAVVWGNSNVDVEPEDRRAVRAGDDLGDELVEQGDGVIAEAQGFDHGLGLPVQQFGKCLADGLGIHATQGDLLTYVVDRVETAPGAAVAWASISPLRLSSSNGRAEP